ncbi:hypothetical protein KR222_001285, partial [Zaprionus bogoriensis]
TPAKSLQREIAQLSRVEHKNIVELYGVIKVDSKTLIIMEYAVNGCLHKYLHGKEKRHYSFLGALNWMYQFAQGVQHLHSMRPKPVLHRDLKPHNLLLFNDFRTLKITDFGTTVEIATVMTNLVGTSKYMAPEVALGNKYTEKCDVYSFGIIFWEVMSRKKPFYYLENPSAIVPTFLSTKGKRPNIEDLKDYPNIRHIKSMIESCWHQDENERPSMNYLVFMLGIDFTDPNVTIDNIR